MGKRLVDLSLYDTSNKAPEVQSTVAQPIKTGLIDLTQFDDTSKKKDVTASSGQESSTDSGFNLSFHSGAGVDLTKKAYTNLNKTDDDEESSGGLRAISTALKSSIPQMAASTLGSVGALFEGIINNAKDVADFYTGKSDYSIGNFWGNLEKQAGIASQEFKKKGYSVSTAMGMEHKGHEHPISSESLVAPIYDLAAEAQQASDALFSVSQKEWGIEEKNRNKSIYDLASEGNISDAFKIAGLSVMKSMPQSVALAMTGGSGGIFAGGTISGAGAEIAKEYQKTGDISGEDGFRAMGYGLAEGLSEMMFQGDLDAIKSIGKKALGLTDDAVKSAVKKLVTEEGKDAAKETIVRSFLNGGVQKTFKGALEEGVEEVASTVASFGVDRILDGKVFGSDYEQLMKDSVDAFVVGAMSGGMMSGTLAKASQVKLTEQEKRSISRYKEILNDDSQSDEVKEIAKSKIESIKKFSIDKAQENYGMLSSIEDKTERGKAIQAIYDIQKLEDEKADQKDEAIQAGLDKIIDEKKGELDSIFQTNYSNILSRTQEGQRAIQALAKSNAEEFVSSNNLFEEYNAKHKDVLTNIENKLEVDYSDLNKAANTLYGIQSKVEQNNTLSNVEKDIVLSKIDAQLNKIEGYQYATKNGETISPLQSSDAFKSESKKRIERANRLQNQRFEGQAVELTTPEGKTIKSIASVTPDGQIQLAPTKSFKTKSTEAAAAEPISVSNKLQIESTQQNEAGEFTSATLVEGTTGNKLRITNPELIDFMVNKQSKEQAKESQDRQYVVDSNLMQAQNKILGKLSNEKKQRLANYYSALQTVNPEAKIILYDNPSDMANGLMAQGYSKRVANKAAKGSKGLHHKGVIHLDISRMSDSTAAHEIFHETVIKLAENNKEEFNVMKEKIMKVLSSSNIAALEEFATAYSKETEAVQSEEFLAQLFGLMTTKDVKLDRPFMYKVALAVKEFIASIAKKLKSDSLQSFADSLFTQQASVEELAKFFEGFAESVRLGKEVDTEYVGSLAEKVSYPETIEDISNEDPYSEGLSIDIPTEEFKQKTPTIKSEKIGKYDFPKGATFDTIDLPIKSLADVVKEYDGRVVIITSDATGYGVDSLGEPILGGFGFSAIKNNVDDNIGFASVGEAAVKSTMSRAFKIHGEGKAVVLIMIQPAFTTIGNSYGVKYFARGMRQIAQNDPAKLESLKQSMKDTILTNKKISDELEREDSKTGKRNTEAALFKLIDSINKDTDINQFTQEFLKDTTFTSRTGILNTFLIDSLDTNSNVAAHPLKVALKENGYSKVDFLKEYGDKSFLTDKMIESNAGGFVVGGFEIDIKDAKSMASSISELQSKGIEHPLFNGKMGGTNHFALDGIYDVNDNFAAFAVPESEIKMSNEQRDELVRENYTDDKFYLKKHLSTPLSERTYTQLKTEYKTEFKDKVVKPLGKLEYKKANVASSVARSLGFNLDETKRDNLRNKEFKQRQRDILRQEIDVKDVMSKSREMIEAAKKASLQTVWRGIIKGFFERNINVRKAMESADFEYALYAMYNKAGASNFGTLKFAKEYKAIFEGLSDTARIHLDNIIFLRRVIAIDSNRDSQRAKINERINSLKEVLSGSTNPNDIKSLNKQIKALKEDLKDVKQVAHPTHKDLDTGKEIATNKASAESTLNKLKEKFGQELYDSFIDRSDKYFKAFSNILKYKYDNGIIDEATYNLYKDYNYSPREFMQFMYGVQTEELSGVTVNSFNSRGSLIKKDELKKIQDGNTNAIELDAAKLLQSAMIAAEVQVSTNKALKALHSEMLTANYDWIKEANYDRYSDGTIRLDKDGSPKILAPDKQGENGAFRNMYYKVDGKRYAFQMKDNLAAEFYDEQLFDKSNIWYRVASALTGASIVRSLATGINIAFPISNIPVDIVSQVHLNDIYAGGVAGQYKQAITGTLDLAEELLKAEFNMGDNSDINNLILEYGQAGGLMLTQTMEGNINNKLGDALGMLGNISELASKLNAYKTMRDNLLDAYYKKNGQDAVGEDLEDIQAKAAFNARGAMDYHRGGLVTKWLDGFIPYLNVLSQVNKITAEYIAKNPTEFIKKIATVGSAVAAITIYNMMVAGDDYDNDDVQNDLLKNIVIFHPFKNADGTRGYTKIAMPNTVKGFLNIFQNQAEGIYYRSVEGKEKQLEAWKADRLQKSLSILVPSSSSFYAPIFKAYKEYTTNIDTWRNRPIYNGVPVQPYAEGAQDKNVTEFMKVLGKWTASTENIRGTEYMTGGISPKRGQKALEDVLPVTNPLIQMGYSLMDKAVNQFGIGNLTPEQRSKFEKGRLSDIPMSFLDAVKNRAVDVTDPKVVFKNPMKEAFDIIQKSENEKLSSIKKQISSAVESGKSFDSIGQIVKDNGDEYLQGASKYYLYLKTKEKINNPQFESEYSQIMFERSPISQGKMIYQMNQDLLTPNKSKETMGLMRDLVSLKLWDANVAQYYLEAYNNEQKSKK